MNKLEILAPAGSMEALIAAISAGCNAVYLGYSEFSARSGAKNFDFDELRWAVSYAHLQKVKIYLTINTIIKNSEIERLVELVGNCIKIGVDAFIVQDIGVLFVLKNIYPDVELHSSTQMNIHSLYGANFVKELGISRLVLARELTLDEIKYIKNGSGMEVETFVHGALCYCYSGQCLMSSSFGDRSGNRGSCAQPCRLAYKVNDKDEHVLSLKDLSAIDMLDKLIEANVDSIKIEGRVKTKHYVYKVVSMYRKYVDKVFVNGKAKVSKKDYENILQVYNRGEFSQGFYNTHNDKKLIGRDRPKHQGIVVGEVVSIKGKKSIVKLTKKLNKGDYIEFQVGRRNNVITVNKDCDTKFVINGISKIGSEVRKLNDIKLNELIEDSIKVQNMNIKMNAYFRVGERSKLVVSSEDDTISVYGDVVDKAKNMPIKYEKIRSKIGKTMDYPFVIDELNIYMDDNIFMPISAINSLRRDGLQAFFNKLNDVNKKDYKFSKANNERVYDRKINVLINNPSQYEVVSCYDVDTVYINVLTFSLEQIESILKNKKDKKIYALSPKIVRDLLVKELDEVKQKLSLCDGILVNSIDSLSFVSELKKPTRIDYSLNTFNNEAVNFYKSIGVNTYMPSLELTYKELANMDNSISEVLIYAHITTMTSASCIKKTTDKCYKKEGAFYTMSDRKKEKIFYETKCTFCYNKIYNPYPLYLIDKIDDFNRIGITNFRLDFNFETNDMIYKVLDEVFNKVPCQLDKFTRGHFEKGIK